MNPAKFAAKQISVMNADAWWPLNQFNELNAKKFITLNESGLLAAANDFFLCIHEVDGMK